MKILITGANGLVGKELYKYLQTYTDFDIDIMTRESHGDIKNAKFDKKYTYVFHLASTTHNYHILDCSTIDAETNILGTQNVLNEMVRTGSNKLIYISTWFVNDGNPLSLYGASKLCAEHYCKAYSKVHNIECCIVRPSNIYGCYQAEGDVRKGFLNNLIYSCIDSNPLKIYDEPYPHTRDYIYVEDVCSALYKIMLIGKNRTTYNVATGHSIPQEYMLEILIKILKKYGYNTFPIEKIKIPEFHRQVGINCVNLNISPLIELRWKPKYNLQKGIDKLVSYYDKQRFKNIIS